MNFLKKILDPVHVQFSETEFSDFEKAIQSPYIQKRWLEKIVEKLRAINLELDQLLAKPDKDRIWEALAVERRTMLRCLAMILEVRDEIESERFTQESQNRLLERYKGAAAPISNR